MKLSTSSTDYTFIISIHLHNSFPFSMKIPHRSPILIATNSTQTTNPSLKKYNQIHTPIFPSTTTVDTPKPPEISPKKRHFQLKEGPKMKI